MREEKHTLLIPRTDGGAAVQRTVDYIDAIAPQLQNQGITVEVLEIRDKDLHNPQVLDAMRRRGVTRLPALFANGQAHVGYREIRDMYVRGNESGIPGPPAGVRSAPPRMLGQGITPAMMEEMGTPEDDLDEYMKQEMQGGGRGGGIDGLNLDG